MYNMSARRVFHSLLGMGALLPALSGNSLHAAEETTARSNPSINLGQDQLIAYYPFDGDANDASGNRLNPISNSDLNYSEGRKGEALLLDGKTFVELPLDLDPELFEHISLNYSLRLDELPEDSEFLKKLQSQSYFLSNAYQGFVSVHDVKGKPSLRAHNSGTVAGIDGRHVLYRERWVDVRIVSTLVEGTNQKGEPERRMRVQLDSGNYSSVAEQLYKPGTTYRTLIVGAWDKAMGWPARGAIDELRIVARAPTEAENQAWRQERNLPAISSSTQATLSAALPVRHQLPAAVTNFDSKQGLLAHFPFDGDAKPVVGDFDPLSVAGTRPTAGKIGQALEFDGQSFVELPIDLSFESFPEQTVSVWIKTDKLDDLTEEQLKAVSQSAYPLSNGYNGLLHLDGVKKDAYFRGASGGAITGTSGKHRALADVWTHVAIVSKLVDGVDAKGKPEKQVQVEIHSGPYITTNVQRYKEGSTTPILTVGAWDASPSYGFHGALDDLRIYARALSAGEISALAAGGVTAFPGDQFDGDPQAFPGDQFDGDPQAFPGDQFDGDPRAFPGGQLDGISTQVPGTVVPVSDPTSPRAADNRDAATPAAVIPTNDTFTPTNANVDEFQDLVDDPDFQDGLKRADWRIVGMLPLTEEQRAVGVVPGSELTVTIRVRKDDPANKIPNVKLIVNPHARQSNVIVPLSVATSDQTPTAQRDVAVKLTVPNDMTFAEGATVTSWRPTTYLLDSAGFPLADTDPNNHKKDLSIQVGRPAEWQDCGGAAENDDGTRTVGGCLTEDDSTGVRSVYIDHSVLVYTDLPFSDRYENLAEQVLLLELDEPLSIIHFVEMSDKVCKGQLESTYAYRNSNKANFDHCGGSSLTDRGGQHLFVGQRGTVITGIAVCRNASNNRLKGIRIEHRRVESDGTLSLNVTPSEDELPNCANWTPMHKCYPGSAAAGVRLLISSGSKLAPRNFVHSVDLACGAVKIREET